MTDDLFDFGFTAVTEEELAEKYKTPEPEPVVDDRAERVVAAILPLLDNLQKDPDKGHIYWPNRYEKIAEFKEHLMTIVADKP